MNRTYFERQRRRYRKVSAPFCALVEAISYAKHVTKFCKQTCIYAKVCLSELKSYMLKAYMTLPRPHHRAGVSCSIDNFQGGVLMAAFDAIKSGIPMMDEALQNIRLGDNVV